MFPAGAHQSCPWVLNEERVVRISCGVGLNDEPGNIRQGKKFGAGGAYRGRGGRGSRPGMAVCRLNDVCQPGADTSRGGGVEEYRIDVFCVLSGADIPTSPLLE